MGWNIGRIMGNQHAARTRFLQHRKRFTADTFAQALVEAGQVPMAIQDIRRAKALATVLEQATVVDADGNIVDLKALDAELNPMAGMPDLAALAGQDDEA